MFEILKRKPPEPEKPLPAFLIGIERDGKANVFTFIRGDQSFKIRTYATISDDLAEWRKQAGLT